MLVKMGSFQIKQKVLNLKSTLVFKNHSITQLFYVLLILPLWTVEVALRQQNYILLYEAKHTQCLYDDQWCLHLTSQIDDLLKWEKDPENKNLPCYQPDIRLHRPEKWILHVGAPINPDKVWDELFGDDICHHLQLPIRNGSKSRQKKRNEDVCRLPKSQFLIEKRLHVSRLVRSSKRESNNWFDKYFL